MDNATPRARLIGQHHRLGADGAIERKHVRRRGASAPALRRLCRSLCGGVHARQTRRQLPVIIGSPRPGGFGENASQRPQALLHIRVGGPGEIPAHHQRRAARRRLGGPTRQQAAWTQRTPPRLIRAEEQPANGDVASRRRRVAQHHHIEPRYAHRGRRRTQQHRPTRRRGHIHSIRQKPPSTPTTTISGGDTINENEPTREPAQKLFQHLQRSRPRRIAHIHMREIETRHNPNVMSPRHRQKPQNIATRVMLRRNQTAPTHGAILETQTPLIVHTHRQSVQLEPRHRRQRLRQILQTPILAPHPQRHQTQPTHRRVHHTAPSQAATIRGQQQLQHRTRPIKHAPPSVRSNPHHLAHINHITLRTHPNTRTAHRQHHIAGPRRRPRRRTHNQTRHRRQLPNKPLHQTPQHRHRTRIHHNPRPPPQNKPATNNTLPRTHRRHNTPNTQTLNNTTNPTDRRHLNNTTNLTDRRHHPTRRRRRHLIRRPEFPPPIGRRVRPHSRRRNTHQRARHHQHHHQHPHPPPNTRPHPTRPASAPVSDQRPRRQTPHPDARPLTRPPPTGGAAGEHAPKGRRRRGTRTQAPPPPPPPPDPATISAPRPIPPRRATMTPTLGGPRGTRGADRATRPVRPCAPVIRWPRGLGWLTSEKNTSRPPRRSTRSPQRPTLTVTPRTRRSLRSPTKVLS